jgi:ATP adenylyltransferase
MKYISSEKQQDGCVFCLAASKNDGADNLIVERRKYSFVILNRYPYTSGHLMVVPFEHQSSIEGLSSETLAEMMEFSVRAIKVLRMVYNPQGFNVGVNIGEAAGAGILDHVHMHIVPRWGGDTNFISTLGKARVLPETLSDTYSRVKSKWYEADQL